VTRDRDADARTLRTVHEIAQAGEHGRAADLAEAALADGLEHPLLLNLAALKLERQDRVVDAEGLLRRAVEIAPRDLASRNALGLCLLRLERPADALAQFDALIRLDPALPFAHVSRGNALHALGHVTLAEAGYRRALELDPRQPVALARLANIAVNRGLYPEARVCAEKALALVPGYPDAVLGLAAAALGERRLEQAEALIRGLLADPRLEPVQRAHARGQLGDILDAAKRPAAAFAEYSACNDELRAVYAGRFGPGHDALEYVNSMNRYFEHTAAATWQSTAPTSPTGPRSGPRGHVFILGFPRSGTTLLEVILEGHPDVVSLEEDELLIDGVLQFMRRPDDFDALARAAPATLDALRAAYWGRAAPPGAAVEGKVFVDKYPLNSLKLPLIARLFPEAKILFACRDPRDIVLSCFRHRFRMSAPLFELLTLEGAARYYDAVMRLVLRLNSTMPLNVCLVRHEDVVSEFKREMQRICAFLNLEWAPAMGDFALRTQYRSVLTPSTAQLVRGLNTEGLGHWRTYRRELAHVLPILDPWVTRFYYDP
jgi:Tfp pilus assembly protein PilF